MKVAVFHNIAHFDDPEIFTWYADGQPLVRVFEFTLEVELPVNQVAVYVLGAFASPESWVNPDTRTMQYSARMLRSVAPGDVVEVDGVRLTYTPEGMRPVTTPLNEVRVSMPGTVPWDDSDDTMTWFDLERDQCPWDGTALIFRWGTFRNGRENQEKWSCNQGHVWHKIDGSFVFVRR